MLGLNNEIITENKIQFSRCCSDPFDDLTKSLYRNQTNRCAAIYRFPPQSHSLLDSLKKWKEIGEIDPKISYYCSVKEICVLEGSNTVKAGYIVRLTELESMEKINIQIKEQNSIKGYISYEPIEGKYVRVGVRDFSNEKHYEIYPLEKLRDVKDDGKMIIMAEIKKKRLLTENELMLLLKSQKDEEKNAQKLESELIMKNVGEDAKSEQSVQDDEDIGLKKLKEEIYNRPNYGKEIVTYRIENGDIIPVDGGSAFAKTKEIDWKDLEKHKELLEIFVLDNSAEGSKGAGRNDTGADAKTILSSRKSLSKILNIRITPFSIKVLQWTFGIVILSFIILSIMMYTLQSIYENNTIDLIGLMRDSFIRYNSVVKSAISTQLLLLACKKYDPKLTNYFRSNNLQDYVKMEQNRIKMEETILYKAQENLMLENVMHTPAHEKFISSGSNNLVYSISKEIDGFVKENVTLDEKSLTFGSELFTVRNFDISEFSEKSQDTDIIIESVRAGLDNEISKEINLYNEDIHLSEENNMRILNIVTWCCVGLICICLIVLVPIVRSVYKSRKKLLSYFLNIPLPIISALSKKCETFMETLQSDKDDAGESLCQQSDTEINLLDTAQNYVKKKSRHYKNFSGNQGLYIKISIIAIILGAYLGTNYYICSFSVDNSLAHAMELLIILESSIGYTQLFDSQMYFFLIFV